MQQLISTKRVKAGNGQATAAARRALFVQAYIANGNNATQAAITAGYSARTAYSQGQRMLKHVEISGQLADSARKLAESTGLNSERILQEVARIAYADPRRFYRPNGTVKPMIEWDDDMGAAVAAIEVDQKGQTTRLKFWDKNVALEKALKHLGLYERDSAQGRESLVLRVEAATPVKR